MKHSNCCQSMKECACTLWDKAKRPTVRQTLRYDLGIYPDGENTHADKALRMHFGGTHTCPLWKLLLVIAALVVTLLVACKSAKGEE